MSLVSGENAEFFNEFANETREHLDAGEASLLRLAKDPQHQESVRACFRALHTIKGGAGFMGLERIQALAHAAEQVLDAMRTGTLEAEAVLIDALLAAVSRLRELLSEAEAGRQPSDDEHELIGRLHALIDSTARYEPHALPSRDSLLGRLVALPPGDADGCAAVLDDLGKLAEAEAWNERAVSHLEAMRSCLGRLRAAGGDEVGALHAEMLGLGEAVQAALAEIPSAAGTAVEPDLIADFHAESGDLLSRAEAVLLSAAMPDQGQIAELLRCFHTIKGMASYLGFPRIERIGHAIESRFTPVRDGTEAFSADHHQLALAGVDALRQLCAELRRDGRDAGPWPAGAAGLAQSLGLVIEVGEDEGGVLPEVPRIGDLLVESGSITRAEVEEAQAALKPGERLGEKLVGSGKIAREMVEKAAARQVEMAARTQGDGYARVSINRLEELVNLVGELLIAQATVSQREEVLASSELGAVVGRQARVVRSVQALALSLRMVPLRATFQKMSRAVHDTARKLGKQVELQLVGEDVEVDRTLAEVVADPLLHMVRNAVDHGIESSSERIAAGKPPAGSLRLAASQAGDSVLVQVSDDGHGLDPARLAAKAKELGLVQADAKLSESEAFALIFLPGFSTAENVTAVSGRGVGMDVVKRDIERVKGSCEISSRLGQGTVFTIRLPLTTAILDAMVLRCASERFLLPVTAVVEAMRPLPGQIGEVLGHGRVIEARGHLVPVVGLGRMFGIAGVVEDPTHAVLLVVERTGGTVALLVDEILGLQQVVIKPLAAEQRRHLGIASSAILGDGRVGLILDPANLCTA